MHWFLDPIKNQYADFNGRTGRQAFWMYILIYWLISLAIGVVEGVIGTMFIGTIFSLALLVPSIAITARRLHDINKSGWWQLIGLIPIVGWVVLIVWCATKSDEGDNQYGSGTAAGAMPAADTDPVTEAAETNTEINEENNKVM